MMDEVVYIDTIMIAEVQPVHSIVAIDEEILTTSMLRSTFYMQRLETFVVLQ